MIDYLGLAEMRKLIGELGVADVIARSRRRDRGRLPPLARVREVGAPREPLAGRRDRADADQRRPAVYSFKYVNGHPKNTAQGLLTVTAFGVLADVAHRLPGAAVRADAHDRAAHRGDVGAGRQVDGAAGQPRDGADRQRRAERVPGDRLSIGCSASASCGSTTSTRAATAKLERNLARVPSCRLRDRARALRGRGRARRRHRHHRDGRQAQRRDPDAARWSTPGMHLNAVGGDCPGKTELHARRAPARRRARRRRVRAAVAHRRRDPAAAGGLSRSPSSRASCAARRRARTSADEVTIFDSVGFALEDFSALRYLHRQLRARSEAPRRIDLFRRSTTRRTCSRFVRPQRRRAAAARRLKDAARAIPQTRAATPMTPRSSR